MNIIRRAGGDSDGGPGRAYNLQAGKPYGIVQIGKFPGAAKPGGMKADEGHCHSPS